MSVNFAQIVQNKFDFNYLINIYLLRLLTLYN